MKITKLLMMLLLTITTISTAFAQDYNIYHDNTHPWSILFYRGFQSRRTLGQTFTGDYKSAHEDLYTLEGAYTLNTNNAFRKFFSPIVDTTQLAGNITYYTGKLDKHDILGFNPYVIFRWTKLPWNRHLYTTLAIAEGVSYVTNVPEQEENSSRKISRFLNYLMLEATFSPPTAQQWQLSLRIEHRSGAYGVYGAGNSGATAVGIGLRYCL